MERPQLVADSTGSHTLHLLLDGLTIVGACVNLHICAV